MVFCKNWDWFLKVEMLFKVLIGIIIYKKILYFLSWDYFLVDGILIEVWVLMKFFWFKDDDGGNGVNIGGGCNVECDFCVEKCKNDIYVSIMDLDVCLYCK